MNTKPNHIAMLIATVVLGAAGQANAAPYRSFDLGTLGGWHSVATAINNHGQVVGHSTVALNSNEVQHATLWDRTRIIDLEGSNPQVYRSSASAINNAGQIVGTGAGAGGTGTYTVRWDGARQTHFAGPNDSYPGINNAGTVAGRSYNGNLQQATVWSNGNTTYLNNLPTGNYGDATAINDAGQVVGNASIDPGYHIMHATRWDGVNATDLGTLGGNTSYARDINNAGQVVGMATTTRHEVHAVIWNGNTIRDLGSPTGYGNYIANAINETGQVVGSFDTGASDSFHHQHAILWDGGVMIDLNDWLDPNLAQAGWVLNEAVGINDRGEIVGNMSNRFTAARHAVLLSAVPEPESYAMLLAGLGLLGFMARRRAGA